MIKFFRKFRLQMLAENKLGKYLFYAIGEILLVVLGILLALQINHWKTNSTNKQVENNYYCNLLADLIHDNQEFERLIEKNLESIELGKDLIKKLYSFQYTRDEIMENYIRVVRTTSYIPTRIAYTDLTNSGNFDLIKNIEIKESLIQNQSDLEALLKKLHINSTYRIERFLSWENVLEFGWQSPAISKGLNLDDQLVQLLPDNKWYLDDSSEIFQKCVEVIFYSMTVSMREVELYENYQKTILPITLKLEKACKSFKN